VPEVTTLISVHTEDCVNPETDEVPLRLAEVCGRRGCRAVFKVTTEKIRSLRRNGREDVLEALKTQDLGFHMTNHSFPPTVPVYTQAMSWDEGVRAFERAERQGYEEWKETFGRGASTYTHGTPTPFAFPALRKWGIPTYAWTCYADIGGAPVHYMGLVMLPASGPNWMHLGFGVSEEGAGQRFGEQFGAIYDRLRAQGGGMAHISAHECEWAMRGFWDENFRQGRLVLPGALRRQEPKPPDEIERGYSNFGQLVEHVLGLPDSRIVTAGEFHELYRDRLVGTDLPLDEVLVLAEAVAEEITFQPLRGQYVSAAESFGVLTEALAHVFRHGCLPRSVPVRYYDGPPRFAETAAGLGALTPAVLGHVLEDVVDYLGFESRVPAEAWVGNEPMAPADFLATTAQALLAVAREGELPDRIPLARGNPTCLRYAPERASISTWPAFPPDFADDNGVAMSRLQCWTLKPATRGEQRDISFRRD